MGLNVNPLIKDLGNMSSHIEETKKQAKALQKNVDLVGDLRGRIARDLQANNRIDWESTADRAILDQLYSLEAFQAHEKIYKFESTEDALALLQDIDTFYNERSHELQLKRTAIDKKEHNLQQYHQEILSIISKLAQCMSIVNR